MQIERKEMKHCLKTLAGGLFLLLLPLLLTGCVTGSHEAQKRQEAEEFSTESKYEDCVIALDAGHGGADPGKVGAGGLTEKEVNLAIALILEEMLKAEGIEVVMTRTQDVSLGDENVSNHKQEDLNTRVEILEKAKADLVVSIHQNSFGDPSVSGPQVFYYTGSEEGKRAAVCLQEALNTGLEIAKPRVVKENDSYYLLKKTSGVLVIAECAFLSNPTEESLLRDTEYLTRVANALKEGILAYLA